MTTTERQPEPLQPRRNTLQRMLEIEKKNKLNRMQTAAHVPLSHTSTLQGRDSISNPNLPNLEQRPASLTTTRRAMTTPPLAVPIPATKVGNGSGKYVIGSHGDVIPAEEDRSEEGGSDASSICHSPGWDDLSGKKRKQEKKEKERREKERRKKEQEKLEMTTKKLRKTRPPPAHQRLSKLAIVMDRTKSASVVPVLNDIPEPARDKNKVPERTRRGSIEIGLKSFMNATKALQTPWKSAQTTPATPTQDTPALNSPLSPSLSKSTSGFIGGLKLRQSEEANTQEVIRQLKIAGEDDGKGIMDSDSSALRIGSTTSSGTSIAESVTRATSTYEGSIRTPQNWESIYAEAARLANTPYDKTVDEDIPIMERNIRKPRKSHPPTSRYFDTEDSKSSKRDPSVASTRNSFQSTNQNSSDGSSEGHRPSAISSERSAVNNGGISVERPQIDSTRGRTSSSYVQHSRQQSHDQVINGFQEGYPVAGAGALPRKSESRGRSIFHRSRSRARNASRGARSTTKPKSSAIAASVSKDGEVVNPVLSQDDPQLHLGQKTTSPTESVFSHHHKSSFSAAGLRSAARAAFSKSVATNSESDSYQSSAEILTVISRPQVTKRAVTTDVSMLRPTPPTKAERIIGETISPTIVQDFAAPPKSSRRNGLAGRQVNGIEKEARTSSSRKTDSLQRARSRSFTDSSEEYSTPDEFSNITTPTISRPHSETGHLPPVEQTNVGDTLGKDSASTSTLTFSQEAAVTTGAVPFDDATESGQESWCRTALPMEMTEDEDRLKTPTGKKETTDHVTSEAPPISERTGLNRQPSLSRSISTPELQDLSFLPALKHQALTRHSKEKSKARKSKQQKSDPTSLSRPPPIPIPIITKSEGSSPTSPLSSQYLQNARLSLLHPTGPHATSSPKLFGHNPNASQGGPEPIAKMFVVCCSCKYFHDMPSKIYECMAKPDNVVRDPELGVSGVVSTSVKCPWCGHGMSTSCCAGYAAVVYLSEKLH